MPYRADAHLAPVVAATFAGELTLELLPGHVKVVSASKTLIISQRDVIVKQHNKRNREVVYPLQGQLVMARGIPRGEVAVWECEEGILTSGLEAAAKGLPFLPWRGGVAMPDGLNIVWRRGALEDLKHLTQAIEQS